MWLTIAVAVWALLFFACVRIAGGGGDEAPGHGAVVGRRSCVRLVAARRSSCTDDATSMDEDASPHPEADS